MELGEDEIERASWLKSTKTDENKEQFGLQLKQTKIRSWTMTELMSRELALEIFDKSWQVIVGRVELQQGEVVQGAEAGEGQEEGRDKVTEIIEQNETPEERKKPSLNHDIREMIRNHKDKAAAKKEEDKK